MSHPIIDLRSRPSFLADFYGATPGTAAFETARWLNRRVGTRGDDSHFTRSATLEGFLAEIRDAGIQHAVVVGRDTPALSISNDRIHEITAPHGALLGIASVDPQTHGAAATVAEIERAVGLGLRGVNIEPGFGTPPLHADDPTFYPVYETCQRLGVPVFLMSGPTTPSLEYTHPAPVGRVAARYPTLPIVCYHGFYPYVNEVIGVAFRHENVYLVPDMYLFVAGSQLYVEAANSFLREQFMFGSSYPFRPMGQTVEDFLALGWKDEVLEDVLAGNARRVLGLQQGR